MFQDGLEVEGGFWDDVVKEDSVVVGDVSLSTEAGCVNGSATVLRFFRRNYDRAVRVIIRVI